MSAKVAGSRTTRARLLVVAEGGPALPAGVASCTADEFLEGDPEGTSDGSVVVNLCTRYHYLSKGYYVSLIAEARGHRPLPPSASIEEVGNPFACLRALREQGADTVEPPPPRRDVTLPGVRRPSPDAPANVRLVLLPEQGTSVSAVLGRTTNARFRRLAAAAFRALGFPLLRLQVVDVGGRGVIARVAPVSWNEAADDERAVLFDVIARGATSVRPPSVASQAPPRRLAVLWDPVDPYAPSDAGAIELLRRAAAAEGLLLERVGKGDLARLAEHDALFIRTNTAVGNSAFAFAQAAEALGLPVIDEPQAIIRCSNKVFLHELFRRHGLPEPRGVVVSRSTQLSELEHLGWPLVLKLPDGTFSDAVERADGPYDFARVAEAMFRRSPLLIAQEFVRTGFDWRVGVLDGTPLWSCRYHMVPSHWQIVRREKSGERTYGRVEAVPLADAPREVLRVATEAATLLGPGLFGVDLKEREDGVVLIEVNDCPNLERDAEDAAEGDGIYRAIASAFVRRISDAAMRAAEPA